MMRVLIALTMIPMVLMLLWAVGSSVAGLLNRWRLRAEYARVHADRGTDAPDVDTYVRERLPEVNRHTSILIGLVVVGLPLALIGTVVWTSMNHH